MRGEPASQPPAQIPLVCLNSIVTPSSSSRKTLSRMSRSATLSPRTRTTHSQSPLRTRQSLLTAWRRRARIVSTRSRLIKILSRRSPRQRRLRRISLTARSPVLLGMWIPSLQLPPRTTTINLPPFGATIWNSHRHRTIQKVRYQWHRTRSTRVDRHRHTLRSKSAAQIHYRNLAKRHNWRGWLRIVFDSRKRDEWKRNCKRNRTLRWLLRWADRKWTPARHPRLIVWSKATTVKRHLFTALDVPVYYWLSLAEWITCTGWNRAPSIQQYLSSCNTEHQMDMCELRVRVNLNSISKRIFPRCSI